MKPLSSVNFLKLVQEFNSKYDEKNKNVNDLSSEDNKGLELLNHVFKKLEIFPKFLKYHPKSKIDLLYIKDEYITQQHICCGGTCGHGICSHIGKITDCDTGCTYLG